MKVEEKPDHKRTLWVYRSSEAIFFAIALTKGAKEAEAFFGPHAEGILNVDRASNYKALTAVKEGTLLLAFCWAHVGEAGESLEVVDEADQLVAHRHEHVDRDADAKAFLDVEKRLAEHVDDPVALDGVVEQHVLELDR